MTDRLDLPLRYREQLEALLREHVPGVEVWAYGSRVNGESHEASDLDLVLRGPTLEPLGGGFFDLLEAIQQSSIPILVQAHDWARLPESFLREIERDYVVLQNRVSVDGAVRQSKWREVPLGHVAQVRSGYAFKSKDWINYGVQVVKIANVKEGNLTMEGCAFVSPQVAEQAGRFNLQEGDILIALTGYVGEVALVRSRDLPAVLNQRVGLFSITDDAQLHSGFLFQLLRHPDTRQHIEGLGYGSAQPNVSPALIRGLSIVLPPLPEQRAIAHVLGTLDDKVELNRRMNETLEAMARALFKSWFVDFLPVRAKMEGRDTGLPPDVADLFPDRLVDSELGPIPEGWKVSEIGREVDVVGGSTPSTKESSYWENGNIYWATPKDLSRIQSPVLIDTERKITIAGLRKISSGLLPVGTVLMSSRAPIGYLAIAQVPLAVNQGFIAIKCGEHISKGYTLFWCHENMDIIKGNASGTTFQEISKRNFRPLKVIVPTTGLLKVFDSIINPILEKITLTILESRDLTVQRDALLPKLVSGKLRVDDARQLNG